MCDATVGMLLVGIVGVGYVGEVFAPTSLKNRNLFVGEEGAPPVVSYFADTRT